jgi:alpha-tubulin suppressor-like RCC1 family protein
MSARPFSLIAIGVIGCGSGTATEPIAALAEPSGALIHRQDRVLEIAAGFRHACAIRADHSLWCWGFNYFGELGIGHVSGATAATEVTSLGHDVRHVSAGEDRTCAIKLDHTLWCWGDNYQNALGTDSTELLVTAPHQVTALGSDVATVNAEAEICAIRRRDRSLWCWNRGVPPTEMAGVPKPVEEMGHLRTDCARSGDGSVWCWGANQYGEAGVGTFSPVTTPTQVALPLPATLLAAQAYTNCARLLDGRTFCWGDDRYGTIGNGTTVADPPYGVATPTEVPALDHWTRSLTNRTENACAVAIDGSVSCWGRNLGGELGVGDDLPHPVPTKLPGLYGVARAVLGQTFGCGLEHDGALWCWGEYDPMLPPAPTPIAITLP